MLISIRGTNGSGKSSIVLELMKHGKWSPQYGALGPRRPEAYHLPGWEFDGVISPTHILGSYHVVSGGCDQIQPYDIVLDLLEKYAPRGHVVFEGVIVSSSYGRVGRFMERYGQSAVMAFLDTPLEVCIENVKKRRSARADEREFNPKNLTSKFNEIVRSKKKMLEESKLRVVDLNFGKAADQILALLGGKS